MHRHKFNAQPVRNDGIRFDSKLEANYYQWLKSQKEAGELVFFLRQVPFHLPGGVKIVIDFQCFWSDGTITFEDTKGVETETFKVKRRTMEATYPVKLKIVKKVPFANPHHLKDRSKN